MTQNECKDDLKWRDAYLSSNFHFRLSTFEAPIIFITI